MKILLLIAAVAFGLAGHACPFCNSSTGKATREILSGPDLRMNLLITTLPFVVFSLLALLVYYWRFNKKLNP